MAVTQYYAWVNDGRPLEPAQPIREIVAQLKAAFPAAAKANLFSWYADEAHYQAEPPQDHTPYSYTPWPTKPQPYPIVCATDVMHRPDLGVDCFKLFDYWIVEARAGRMPWCKYLIWQGWIYDVRENWAPRGAANHFDHIHISTRTDQIDASLGGWSLIPGQHPAQQEDDMWTITAPSGTIYLFPGDLYDGKPVAIPQTGFDEKIKPWWACGVRDAGKSAVEPAAPAFHVTEPNAPWPPASTGGAGPTAQEIAVAVVDEEHSRLAE